MEPRSLQLLKKYNFSPEAGFSTSSQAPVGAERNQGFVNMVKDFFGPEIRSLQNIGTAGVTIPQAFLSSLVGKFNPQAGAQIASPDILGTQKIASEIQNNPQESLMRQGGDSAALLLEALLSKAAPKVFSKTIETMAPGKTVAKFTQKGIQKSAGKMVNGNELALELINQVPKEKANLVAKKSFQKGIQAVMDDLANKELDAKAIQDLFIKHGGGFTSGGKKGKAVDAAIDRIMRSSLRKFADQIDAGDVIKAVEQAAKGQAREHFVKGVAKGAAYQLPATATGLGLGTLGYKLFGGGR